MTTDTALKNIKLLVLDVDGVLTDSTLYFNEQGEYLKAFNSKDGAGITFFQNAGLQTGIITGRNSPQVQARVDNLKINHLFMGIDDKLPVLDQLLSECGLSAEQAAYIGDDLPDLPPMNGCGISFAPADAVQEVRDAAAITLAADGGRGAVREAIELILKAQGLWDTIVARYL